MRNILPIVLLVALGAAAVLCITCGTPPPADEVLADGTRITKELVKDNCTVYRYVKSNGRAGTFTTCTKKKD